MVSIRVALHSPVLRLPLRPRPASALPRQWRQRASVSDDSKLHPNPNVVPNTDPQSPRPSGNPERADHAGSPAEGVASGTSNLNAEQNSEKGPNMDQLPHISEESAAMSKSMGTQGPQLEQGTPVGEVVKGDKEAAKNLPKVMRDALNKQQGGTRSFSTSARRAVEEMASSQPPPNDPLYEMNAMLREQHQPKTQTSSSDYELTAPERREDQAYYGQWFPINRKEARQIAKQEATDPDKSAFDETWKLQQERGLRFGEPVISREKQRHMQRRYQSVVEQVTNMIMLHGKKARAQRHVSEMLTHLQKSAAPSAASGRRLMALPAHAPNLADLPRHPVAYLTYALDAVAPLMRIRSVRGLAGGGAALQLPYPLQIRQRRRTAIVWILDAVQKRKGATSDFPKRFAEEVISIVEGRSSVWGKRDNVHRVGVAGRSNLGALAIKKGRR